MSKPLLTDDVIEQAKRGEIDLEDHPYYQDYEEEFYDEDYEANYQPSAYTVSYTHLTLPTKRIV